MGLAAARGPTIEKILEDDGSRGGIQLFLANSPVRLAFGQALFGFVAGQAFILQVYGTIRRVEKEGELTDRCRLIGVVAVQAAGQTNDDPADPGLTRIGEERVDSTSDRTSRFGWCRFRGDGLPGSRQRCRRVRPGETHPAAAVVDAQKTHAADRTTAGGGIPHLSVHAPKTRDRQWRKSRRPLIMNDMSRGTRVLVLLVSTPLVVLVLVGGLLGAVQTPAGEDIQHLRVFHDVLDRIHQAYVEPADMERVMDGAMRGLADSLDPESSYLAPEEVKLVQSESPLPAGELGLVVTRQYYLRIIGVEDGSPADRAGLQTGDFIRAIDDTPTRDMSAFAGTRRLRGPIGSTVSLLVIRGNAAEPHEVTVVREAPRTERAAGRLLDTGEAYVRVSSFESGAAAALRQAITALGPAATSRGVIIDVRDTADGPEAEGIAAARLFVRQGVLATLTGRTSNPRIVESAAGDGALTMPIVLLVSNGTAHAAEVFAAALANNGRATLVGEPTAGIAANQQLFPLPEGHGLWLTTERYVQTDGKPIHGSGLAPDVPVAIASVGFDERPPMTDEVLDRAREQIAGTGASLEGRASPGAHVDSPASSRSGPRPDQPPTTTPLPSSPR